MANIKANAGCPPLKSLKSVGKPLVEPADSVPLVIRLNCAFCWKIGNVKEYSFFFSLFATFAFGSKLLATSELENNVCVTICSVCVKVIPSLNLSYAVASTNASLCFIHSQCPWRNYFVSANFAK